MGVCARAALAPERARAGPGQAVGEKRWRCEVDVVRTSRGAELVKNRGLDAGVGEVGVGDVQAVVGREVVPGECVRAVAAATGGNDRGACGGKCADEEEGADGDLPK